jgi:hypothetical protein
MGAKGPVQMGAKARPARFLSPARSRCPTAHADAPFATAGITRSPSTTSLLVVQTGNGEATDRLRRRDVGGRSIARFCCPRLRRYATSSWATTCGLSKAGGSLGRPRVSAFLGCAVCAPGLLLDRRSNVIGETLDRRAETTRREPRPTATSIVTAARSLSIWPMPARQCVAEDY